MDKSRLLHLVGLRTLIAQQEVRREAQRLIAELARLDALIKQIASLELSYNDHLRLPDLRPNEYRDTIAILTRLHDRRTLDKSRHEMLTIERNRLSAMLVEKQRHIERLADEHKAALKKELAHKQEIRDSLQPERRR